jgi:hypothetical protein
MTVVREVSMSRSHPPTCAAPARDFDLHGLAGIRLLNPSPGDAAAVARQLGPIQAPLADEPDILVRFVDRLPQMSPVHSLGMAEAGFTEDAFLVWGHTRAGRRAAQIAFDRIGRQCEIVCETGLSTVPLLLPILNLTLLGKGVLPLHASAFTYDGKGVIVTGWAKGGKTETLLAFLARGATYVGDEWVYLSGDGQRMYGLPEPIRVWDWHLEALPQYWRRVDRRDRVRLRALQRLIRWMERRAARTPRGASPGGNGLDRLESLLKRQLSVRLPVEKLVGHRLGPLVGTPEKILFVVSHDAPEVMVEPIDPREIAQRMVFSLQYERLKLMADYWKFRFGFPERTNELIEQAEERQRQILLRVLRGKEAYTVYHPYPVALPALFDAIVPLLDRPVGRGSSGDLAVSALG